MCRTEKQLVAGVALVLFIGLMVALCWSLWGDSQLNTTPRPRDIRAAEGAVHEQRDRCLIKYGGCLVLHYVSSTTQAFSFDLCNVINCKEKNGSSRDYDPTLAIDNDFTL